MGLSKKVKFDFKLTDFEEVLFKDKDVKDEVMADVADFVLKEVLSKVADGNSPVSNNGSFKKLSKLYAKRKAQEGARPIANLELQGDMLASVDTAIQKNKITIAVSKDQEDKADGHNQITSAAKSWANTSGMPRRAFIPDKNRGETFKKDIVDGIRRIIRKANEEAQ